MDKKSKNPEIRFKGFTEDWTTTTLGNIADSFEYGLNAAAIKFDGINKYIRITDINDKTNNFNTNSLTSPGIDLEFADNFKLQEGDLLLARTGASVGKTYLYKTSDGLVYYAGFLIRARLNSIHNSYFIFQNTLTDDYKKYIRITSQRSGQPGVNAQEYSEYKLIIPKPNEQKQIGTFFQNLDNLITLHQKKYDKLVILKKAMLVKMFPEKGALVPEIRFKGFTGNWEEMRLGDFAQIKRGLTYSPINVANKGIKVLRSSNILEDTFVQKEDDVYVNEKAINIEFAQENDILITSANGSSRLVGKHAILKNLNIKAVHGGFMLIARTKYPYFLNASMSSPWYREFINMNMAGGNGAIGNLKSSDLEEHYILIPHEDEQQKIGSYFESLDNQIDLHKKQLEKLNTIKKACFTKMFVAQD